jgi:hypothetical protein
MLVGLVFESKFTPDSSSSLSLSFYAMTNDAQLQKNTSETVTVSEAPPPSTTTEQQPPQPQTQPIPGSTPPAEDSRSRHVNAPSQPQTQTQQQVIYAPTPLVPRRASQHEPRRRSVSPRAVDDYPSLALTATEHLGRIPSSTQSLPPPRSHSRSPAHAHARHDQHQRPHSLDDERHSIPVPDTSWIVPAEKRHVRVKQLLFCLPSSLC